MRLFSRAGKAVAVFAAAVGLLAGGVTPASADVLPLPWPAPGSLVPLPPDPTVPYLPGVGTICPQGQLSCYQGLQSTITGREATLGCDHDVIFNGAYKVITDNLVAAVQAGRFNRPDRLNHEATQYGTEYLNQWTRWQTPSLRPTVSPAWAIAFQASDNQSNTALGDVLMALGAHILRDNPIRAIEQSEGVLRLPGTMPAASGRPDHDVVNDVLQESLPEMLSYLAAHDDPTIDDGAELFGTIMDEEGLYVPIWGWRELAWRNAETLRKARALGGVNGLPYQLALATVETNAATQVQLLAGATLTTPAANAARNAYCAAHHAA